MNTCRLCLIVFILRGKTLLNYFQKPAPALYQVRQLPEHIFIYLLRHWKYILLRLIKVIDYLLICWCIGMQISEVGNPVGTFKDFCIARSVIKYSSKIVSLIHFFRSCNFPDKSDHIISLPVYYSDIHFIGGWNIFEKVMDYAGF